MAVEKRLPDAKVSDHDVSHVVVSSLESDSGQTQLPAAGPHLSKNPRYRKCPA